MNSEIHFSKRANGTKGLPTIGERRSPLPPDPLLEANEKHPRPPPALFDEDGTGWRLRRTSITFATRSSPRSERMTHTAKHRDERFKINARRRLG